MNYNLSGAPLLRKIFTEQGLDEIPEHFWDNDLPICWYPSCGYDFRHIFFWDNLRLTQDALFPRIFIHTDMACLNHNPYPEKYMTPPASFYRDVIGMDPPNPLFYHGYILDVFGNNKALKVKRWTELFLRRPVFDPNYDLYYFKNNIGKMSHRIFAIECELLPEEVPVMILFFSMENYNFFYDVVLENGLKIDYLSHINDGGASMGSSKDKMDFIYIYTDTIGLSRMVIDLRLEGKKYYAYRWAQRDRYKHWPRVSFSQRTLPEVDIEDWKDKEIYFPVAKGIYIKNKYDTGNSRWRYSYFYNEPVEQLPNRPGHSWNYDQYYYYERSSN